MGRRKKSVTGLVLKCLKSEGSPLDQWPTTFWFLVFTVEKKKKKKIRPVVSVFLRSTTFKFPYETAQNIKQKKIQ